MAFLTVGKENSTGIALYYEDHGSGDPVILVHGWPLSGASWEKQLVALLAAGYRVITLDRRGFGRSSQPASGYDYDTLAADVHAVIEHLDLKNAALAGFSMGGGEVARYLGKYGTGRVKKAIFISSIAPALGKKDDNPEGVDASVFAGVKSGLEKDRAAFLVAFLQNFYNVDKLKGSRVSEEAVHASWVVGVGSSAIAMQDCVDIWGTDLRGDLKDLKIPVLIIHGDSDRIVPLEHSGARMPKLVPGAKLVVLKDAPHGVLLTHADEVNAALLEFLKT